MEGRGFWPQTLDEWDIGYDWHSDRVTIPVHDRAGNLVGFKGRAWYEKHPKYLVIGDARDRTPRYHFQTYRKSEVVFGLNRCEPHPGRVIIVEGELNVLAMKQHGYSNVVAVAGAEFSPTQAKLIVESVDEEAIVFFDANRAGIDGTAKVAQALSPHMAVRAVMGAPGDAAELDENSVDELVEGALPTLELAVRGILPVIEKTR
jgi:DNA primase